MFYISLIATYALIDIIAMIALKMAKKEIPLLLWVILIVFLCVLQFLFYITFNV